MYRTFSSTYIIKLIYHIIWPYNIQYYILNRISVCVYLAIHNILQIGFTKVLFFVTVEKISAFLCRTICVCFKNILHTCFVSPRTIQWHVFAFRVTKRSKNLIWNIGKCILLVLMHIRLEFSTKVLKKIHFSTIGSYVPQFGEFVHSDNSIRGPSRSRYHEYVPSCILNWASTKKFGLKLSGTA